MPDQAEYLRRVAAIADVVRAEAAEADRHRRLGDQTIAALRASGLARMLLPVEDGGGGLTFAESFPVFEAMARVDGSTGWNLNIAATAATMAAALGDEARAEILGDPDALFAAMLNFTTVRARRVEGGYVFDGRATFLSGSSYAQWLAIGGWVHQDGKPLFDRGAPAVVRGAVPMAAVPVEDTWHVAGMRSTASHDATITDLFVPDRYLADGTRTGLAPHDGTAHIPLATRFGAPLAFVGLGAARGAIDALAETGGRVALGTSGPMRERVDVQIEVARAHALVEAAEAFLVRTWDRAMATVARGERISLEQQAMLRLSYVTAADNAATAADLVCRVAGSAALYESDRIERFWRDAHAVTKHAMVSVRGYERVGRVLLGLDPLPGLL